MDRTSGRYGIPVPASVPPLVGRTREQAFLREELVAALGGRGRLVLLGGEAGIGKTSLARDLAGVANARGACVLTGHCYDLTNTPPYGPWLDLVAGYQPDTTLPPPPAAFADGRLERVTDQAALFAEVRRFLAGMGAVRPVLVVLEDLHWTDPASLELLRHLGSHLHQWPVLLLATYRIDELTRHNPFYQHLPALVREADGLRLDLPRLDEDDLRLLVSTRYGLPAPDETRLVRYVAQHADGNPYFTSELLRSLQEETLLRRSDDRWALARLDRVVVPSLLRQVIDGRVARCGEEIRKPLAIASVIGQQVPLDLWAELADLDEDALLAVVEQAIEAHLLEAARDGTRVHFVHALTREALYEGMLPPRRRLWHRRAAEALVARDGADPDAVAFHFQQAGDPRAAEWLVRAGERAQRSYAWLTAKERFADALALLEGDAASARERGWLHYRIGRLLRFAEPGQGVPYLEAAERAAAVAGDPILAAYALADRGMLRCYAGNLRRGLTEMAAGVDALDALPVDHLAIDATVAAWVADTAPDPGSDGGHALPPGVNLRRGVLIVWLAHAGRFAEARAMGEALLAGIAAVPQPDATVLGAAGDALQGLGHAYAALGRPEEARRALERSRAAHGAIGHHALVAVDALWEVAEVLVPFRTTHLAERQRVRAEADAAWAKVAGAMSTEGPPHLAYFGNLMGVLLLEGVWADARDLERAARADGTAIAWQVVVGHLAGLARDQGLPELAWSLVREVLPDGPATEPGGSVLASALQLQRVAAQLALDAGAGPAAREWLAAHDRWLVWSGSVVGQAEGEVLWGRYERAVRQSEQAQRRALAALARAAEPRQPLASLAARRLLGQLDADAGRRDDAERHLREALALAGACGAPFERALTLLALAELRVASGGAAEADVLLAEVRAICEPLGALPTLARVDVLAARLTGAPADRSLADGIHLSPREREVLALLVAGRNHREIGEALFLSKRTVESHVARIFEKFGVRTRAAAISAALAAGLVDYPAADSR